LWVKINEQSERSQPPNSQPSTEISKPGIVITRLSLDESGISADSFIPMSVVDAKEKFASQPVISLTNDLDSDVSFAAATYWANTEAWQLLKDSGLLRFATPLLTALKEQTGVSLESDVLPELGGSMVLSLTPGDVFEFKLTSPGNLMRTFLQTGSVFLKAGLKNEKNMVAVLKQSAQQMAKRNHPLNSKENKDSYFFQPKGHTAQPMKWGVCNSHYFYLLGERVKDKFMPGSCVVQDTPKTNIANSNLLRMFALEANTSVAMLRVGILSKQLSVNLTKFLGKTGFAQSIQPVQQIGQNIGDMVFVVNIENDGVRLRIRQ